MSEIVEDKVLDYSDLQSLTWVRLKKHFEQRLAYLRTLNDNDQDPTATAVLRGRIREIKNSIALGESQASQMEANEG